MNVQCTFNFKQSALHGIYSVLGILDHKINTTCFGSLVLRSQDKVHMHTDDSPWTCLKCLVVPFLHGSLQPALGKSDCREKLNLQ